MKKAIILTLLMVYGFASFGVSLNYFYCCGSLKTVSIGSAPVHNAADECPMKGAKKGCCENKTVNHKIDVDQNASSATQLFLQSLQLAPALLPSLPFLAKANMVQINLFSQAYKNPPPILLNTSIVFLSVFRI